MRVITVDNVEKQISDSPLFSGGQVSRQTILGQGDSGFFTIAQVNFSPGARNGFHTHTTDQILIVTAGKGICATETEQVVVKVGDIIQFPAGEKHWHGATEDSHFSHIYIVGKDSTTTPVKKDS